MKNDFKRRVTTITKARALRRCVTMESIRIYVGVHKCGPRYEELVLRTQDNHILILQPASGHRSSH